ncbi:PEB3 protein, partial [Acromyrmex heyeri]
FSTSSIITVETMSQLSCIALIIAMNVLLYVHAKEHYTDEFDNTIDIDTILHNDTLRNEYHECYMNTGPCNTIAQKKITGMFREALLTNCEKCDELQKALLKKTIKWYAKYKPELLLEKIAKGGEVMVQKTNQ